MMCKTEEDFMKIKKQYYYGKFYYCNDFGDWLHSEIIRLGITQRGISMLLEIPEQNLSMWIHGRAKPSLDRYFKLCEVLEELNNK
jgi:plasmid maintenance system antidote protein VapI